MCAVRPMVTDFKALESYTDVAYVSGVFSFNDLVSVGSFVCVLTSVALALFAIVGLRCCEVLFEMALEVVFLVLSLARSWTVAMRR